MVHSCLDVNGGNQQLRAHTKRQGLGQYDNGVRVGVRSNHSNICVVVGCIYAAPNSRTAVKTELVRQTLSGLSSRRRVLDVRAPSGWVRQANWRRVSTF